MRTICSFLLLLFCAPVAQPSDAPSSPRPTLTLTFSSQPKITLAGMRDNSLGGRWDAETQTLRIVDRFGIGTERFFVPDARDMGGVKCLLPRHINALVLVGRRNGDPSTKPRDVHGNVLGVHEMVVLLAFRKTF